MKTPTHSNAPKYRTSLIATVGTSPAVLTETVWALAHPPKKGMERVVPDEIIVLTTLLGKKKIEEQLFGNCGAWARLVSALEKEGLPVDRLVFGEASIRLLDNGKTFLEDIRSAEENEAVADLFLREIRGITENPKTRLFASIAGGRKTMGALLLSCMSLLGREQDHVLHILVNEPFDTPRLDPPFFFPESKAKHAFFDRETNKTTLHLGTDARLDLIDLPFVKMRGWYQDKFKTLPPRYSDLVRAAQSSGPAATPQKPVLKFDFRDGVLFADDDPIKLSPVEFLTLAVDLLFAPDNLAATLVAIRSRVGGDFGWLGDFAAGTSGGKKFEIASAAKVDLTHARSSLRGKLRAVPSLAANVDTLVPFGKKHGAWPAARISADVPAFRKMTGPW